MSDPTDRETDTDAFRARLVALGMTEPEIALWNSVADVARGMLELPPLHPMAEHEMGHAIHRVQDLLLARPGLRAEGWGREPDAALDPDRLARFGMTEPEIWLWRAVADVAGRMLALHGPEHSESWRHEVAHGMHRVQDGLLARPGWRAVQEPPS